MRWFWGVAALAAAGGAILPAAPALAQVSDADFREAARICALIDTDARRLECFDRIAAPEIAHSGRIFRNEGRTGKWDVREAKSPIDDSMTIIIALESNEMVPMRFGTAREPARLALRCQENQTTAIFSFPVTLTVGEVQVAYRIGTRPAQTATWNSTTNHKGTGVAGGTAIAMLKEMMAAETFTLRLTPYGQASATVTFDIRGLAEVIKPLRARCNW